MTGAPMPRGADAVVMVEHVRREARRVIADHAPPNPASSSIRKAAKRAPGEIVLHSGKRLDYTDVAMLAAFGQERASGLCRNRGGDRRHRR